MISRRNFIQAGVLSPMAAAPARASQQASIQRYVTLGKTGLRVSEIGFGSSSSEQDSLVRRALDKGVTLFDAAESYRSGRSEVAIGKGLKGSRDNVVLTSKTKAYAGTSEIEMMQALEGSLRRLQTDYLDIYFNHAVNHVDRMQNDAWANFTERAIRQGKIRFRGMSGHGSRLAQCLEYSIDHDLVDVILCAYNFGEDPDIYDRLRHTFHFVAIQSDLPPVLDKAREKNIGVIAMKTLMGARLNDMRQFESTDRSYAQAALRWVLASDRVDAAVISMTSNERIDEYIAASGQEDDVAGDVDLL
ncbi:MAG: aldo/keto reductase, partial [Pseudomonadota bacterium]